MIVLGENLDIYQGRVMTFEVLVSKAISLSIKTNNKQVATWEEQIGSDLFGRLCAISFSLLKLIPESEVYKKIITIDLWDYSSICSLTRMLLDSYLIYYHYCIDIPVDINERKFKEQFWNYYIDYKRIKMLELSISADLDTNRLDRIRESNAKEFEVITNNPFYQQQNEGLKKKIKKCEIFQIPNNSEIAEKCGFKPEFYKSTYEYLSRYTHSDSFCMDQLAKFKAGDDGAYHLIESAVYFLNIILSLSIRDFVKIHPELDEELDDFIREEIVLSESLARYDED